MGQPSWFRNLRKTKCRAKEKKEKAQTILIFYLYLSSNALSYYKLELEAFISKQK